MTTENPSSAADVLVELDPATDKYLVGSSGQADLKLPGPAGRDEGFFIEYRDGVWRLEVPAGMSPVEKNHTIVSHRAHLRDGDELEFFGSRLRVELGDTGLKLLGLSASDYQTAPPIVEKQDADGDQDDIIVSEFRRKAKLAADKAENPSPWRYIVAAAIAVLAVLAWALFSAQSVRFETEPAKVDSIQVSGGWMQLKLGERLLLRPGNHKARISSEGYYDAYREFELGRDEPLLLREKLEPLPGTVEIRSEPVQGAEVWLEGEKIGITPLRLENVVRGSYALQLRAERYLSWQGELQVEGLAKVQNVHAQLVPRFGRVSFNTEPVGATVLSQEEALGTTPGTVEIIEGQQSVSLVLDGYKPADIDISVLADTDQSLPVLVLEPANARLAVSSRPAGANVSVDGKYRGLTPLTLSLEPDQKYLIQLSRAGYARTTRSVSLKAASVDELFVDLSARNGRIDLGLSPADARVYVNGRVQAPGTTRLQLPAAPHRIEVRRDGYEPYRKVLTPRPGFPQRVAVKLRTVDQARVAAIDSSLKTSQGQVLRYVDPGSFMMGASRREKGRRANESLRQVTITRPYYIGTREISNREYQQFRANHDSGSSIAFSLVGDKNPAANMSWQDAAAYCNWLSEKDGLNPVYEDKFGRLVARRPTPNGYRLPTEAEWAFAARHQGGKGFLKFPWGQSLPPAKESGNYADKAASALAPTHLSTYDDGYAATAPVASFKPNALGLYDLGGNVAEWVHDYYQVYTPDSTRVWTDPEGPLEAKHNVIRGSSWKHATETNLRTSFRDFGSAGRPDLGFRIARTAPGYQSESGQ